METKKQKLIKLFLISFLLGSAVYYVFLCFSGVVMAFLINTDSLIVHNFIKPLSNGSLRHFVFYIYANFKYIMVSLIVLFLATYFLSRYLSEKLILNSLFLTLGRLTTDFYYFQKYPFESTYFFSSKNMVDIFHLIVWLLCTIAVIYLGHALKAFKNNKGRI